MKIEKHFKKDTNELSILAKQLYNERIKEYNAHIECKKLTYEILNKYKNGTLIEEYQKVNIDTNDVEKLWKALKSLAIDNYFGSESILFDHITILYENYLNIKCCEIKDRIQNYNAEIANETAGRALLFMFEINNKNYNNVFNNTLNFSELEREIIDMLYKNKITEGVYLMLLKTIYIDTTFSIEKVVDRNLYKID